jgi:hypothetical protein
MLIILFQLSPFLIFKKCMDQLNSPNEESIKTDTTKWSNYNSVNLKDDITLNHISSDRYSLH